MERFYTEAFVQFIQMKKKLSKETAGAYKRDLHAFLAYLEERGITWPADVNESDLSLYMLRMKHGGKSPATISRAVATLRNYFGFLQNNGYLHNNPAYNLSPPKVERKEPDLLSLKEVEKLLNQPDKSVLKGARDAAMLELLYGTGLKVTELLNLNMDDVHLDLAFIRCRSESDLEREDTSQSRFVPIGKYSQEALKLYLQFLNPDASNQQPLFMNSMGDRLTRQGVWKILKAYRAAAGIEKEVTPHNLRHTFAVHLLQNGADIRSVQELLGFGENSRVHMNHFRNHAQRSLKEIIDLKHPRG